MQRHKWLLVVLVLCVVHVHSYVVVQNGEIALIVLVVAVRFCKFCVRWNRLTQVLEMIAVMFVVCGVEQDGTFVEGLGGPLSIDTLVSLWLRRCRFAGLVGPS